MKKSEFKTEVWDLQKGDTVIFPPFDYGPSRFRVISNYCSESVKTCGILDPASSIDVQTVVLENMDIAKVRAEKKMIPLILVFHYSASDESPGGCSHLLSFFLKKMDVKIYFYNGNCDCDNVKCKKVKF